MKSSNENFINALAVFNGGSTDEINQIVDYDMLEQITETHEKLSDFISKRGNPQWNIKTEFGNVYVWENIQRGKGLRRGDLYVVEYDDITLTYFDGE